ncbi:MAG: hypothetical protein V1882_10785 [Candidatus Omnitrophota bacterium]
MYFWIIAFGFVLAMRGARPALLQRPLEGLKHIGRENNDFFFTLSLILAIWNFAAGFERIENAVREYAILGFGLMAYLLSRYQKKGDVFFLSVLAGAFMISLKRSDISQAVLWAGAVSAGVALFQGVFLGLRHRLLFSRIPEPSKGWPALCLLAGFISMALWGFVRLVF